MGNEGLKRKSWSNSFVSLLWRKDRRDTVLTLSPSKIAWRRFRKNRLAMGATSFIGFSVLIAFIAYMVIPDHSPLANTQYLELARMKPGASCEMLIVQQNRLVNNISFPRKILYGWQDEHIAIPVDSIWFEGNAARFFPHGSLLASDIDLADILFAIDPEHGSRLEDGKIIYTNLRGIADSVSLEEARRMVVYEHLVRKRFPLGTDRYGRDMLSQLIVGMRVSLSVGFVAVAISLLIGIFLGALAGYFGGRVDSLVMWFVNVIWSMPSLLLVIAITFALGKGFWQVFIAIGLTMWVEVARVTRGQIMSIREKEFVEAGKALGYGPLRIMFRHVLPNVMSPVIVISAANFATAILLEAGLSFLGIGVQPPMPSWGTMIRDHAGYIILDSAYLAFLPGLAIMLMVLSFMVAGNGLRDALDVKGS